MKEIFNRWSKEKDKNILKDMINNKIKNLYMNQQLKEVHEIFNSEWKNYIDLSYDKGSILEFAGLIKERNEKGRTVKELKFLEEWIKNSAIDKNEFHYAIHNILMTAVNYNRKDIIIYITKEQNIININFNYADCAIISNCFPKNNNQEKQEIFHYFMMECGLSKTPEIEKILKKHKKENILNIFDKIDLYKKISNNLIDNKPKQSKIKI